LVLAYDLDALRWLGLRVYQGTKKLSKGLIEIVHELLKHRGTYLLNNSGERLPAHAGSVSLRGPVEP
jgi:hypothetical protein